MKSLLLALMLVPTLSYAAISDVVPNARIEASKINEVIGKVNSLDATKADSGFQVGDVKHSVLSQAQFQLKHGSCWRLMDGASLSGTDLGALVGTLPDARGKFLRNHGGSSAGLREIQADAFQGHGHKIPFSDPGTTNPNRAQSLTAPGQKATNTGNEYSTEWQMGAGQNTATPDSMGNGFPRTAAETRPTNLTVNMFVKVNELCN